MPGAVTEILETPLGDDVVVPTVTPVRVPTRDEVADVADALNTVQDSALDLAVEQAVLRRNIADSFVNLGRRNQNLLGRQLDFITELESRETDPDTLASLFRLDHLATRMRRNAESLLVLAGIEPPRQWAAPLRLADVIRAALGEVEDYQRVIVRGVEPAPWSVPPLPTWPTFSPSSSRTRWCSRRPTRPSRSAACARRPRSGPGGYTLAVIDSGLGMSARDIEAANRRLAGVESFTVAPSKYLGHYVAGNLAARHDIAVQLHDSPGGGVTVTVELPAEPADRDADGRVAAVGPPRQTSAPGRPARAGARFPAAGDPVAVPDTPLVPSTDAQLAALAGPGGRGLAHRRAAGLPRPHHRTESRRAAPEGPVQPAGSRVVAPASPAAPGPPASSRRHPP